MADFSAEFSNLTTTKLGPNRYTALIAVNDDLGDGSGKIRIRELDMERYNKNPVVMFDHGFEESVPVGRTLRLNFEAGRGLVAEFEFLQNDEFAARIKNAWDRGFIKAASIRARNLGSGRQELIEWSIVAIPADRDAVRSLIYEKKEKSKMSELTEEKIRSLIEESKGSNQEDLARTIAEIVRKNKETEDRLEQEKVAAIEAATNSLKEKYEEALRNHEQTKKTDVDTAIEKKEQEFQEQLRCMELRTKLSHLVPDGTDISTLDEHGILVAIARSEVKDAESRSIDYLTAKVEEIDRRRKEAAEAEQRAKSHDESVKRGHNYARILSGSDIRMMVNERKETV